MVNTHIETTTNDQLQTLVDTREGLELARDEAITKIGILDIELGRMMQGLGAEIWTSTDGMTTATLKAVAVWNDPELDRLREHFSPEEIEEYYNKPRPRSWNKRKLISLSKRGGIFKEILDKARTFLPDKQIAIKRKV